uniref:uncharacterized protein LOC120335335 n=1 Tax=Styela clava TaxID=7725 RepID=UPI00193A3343|nr:uncharacterized protein LOC120335335 [Styela clava]
MQFIGSQHISTTSYHPASNAAVERQIRQLKASLMTHCRNTADWYQNLGLVLLGMRTAIKQDLGYSSAELLYGTPLKLPGEFFSTNQPGINTNPQAFMKRLSNFINKLKPIQPRTPQNRKTFLSPELNTCSHIFLRVDAVRRPLIPPYQGPFRVIQKYDKFFKIDFKGKPTTVSIDRVKPAHEEIFTPDTQDISNSNTPTTESDVLIRRYNVPISTDIDAPLLITQNEETNSNQQGSGSIQSRTRHGRTTRPPQRDDYVYY